MVFWPRGQFSSMVYWSPLLKTDPPPHMVFWPPLISNQEIGRGVKIPWIFFQFYNSVIQCISISVHNYCNATEFQCPSAMRINMPQGTTQKYKCVCPDNARYIDEKCDFSPCFCFNGGTCKKPQYSSPKCR